MHANKSNPGLAAANTRFFGYRYSFVIPTVRREGQMGIFIYVRGEIWSRMDERNGLGTLGVLIF